MPQLHMHFEHKKRRMSIEKDSLQVICSCISSSALLARLEIMLFLYDLLLQLMLITLHVAYFVFNISCVKTKSRVASCLSHSASMHK